MQTKWNEMRTADKVMIAVRMIASIGVIVLALLQLFGVWEQAINVTTPLMGVVLLVQSIQEWKQRRGVAIFSLCAALFVLACAIVVWFVR